MFNSGILDVVLGLVFVYSLLSLVGTAINEWIEGILKKRSATLEQGIRELLDDEDGTGLACDVYNHPLIYSLFRGKYEPAVTKKNLPSYIPAKNFAIALTDIILTKSTSPDHPIQSFRDAVGNLPNERVKGALMALVDEAGNNIDRTRKNVEDWFDSGMDRVSGWYKRHVQRITLAVAFLMAILLNVDSINIATRLSFDVTMRESLVAAAQGFADTSSTGQSQPTQVDLALVAQTPECDTPECKVSQNLNEVAKLGLLGLPIGWNMQALPDSPTDWLTRVLGWIITAFAVSLGAPFWFDILNKVMVVRSTVKPKEKSGNEPAVDR